MIETTEQQKLEDVARALNTTAVLDVLDVNCEVYQDQGLLQFLAEAQTCVPMENGDVLTSDVTTDGMALARSVQKRLKAKNLPARVRPAAANIVKLFLMNSQANTRDTRSVQVVEDQQGERSNEQRLLYTLIDSASKGNSSDVHIETNKVTDQARIKYRVDGELDEKKHGAFQWTEAQARALAAMVVNFEAEASGGSSTEGFDENIPNDTSCTVRTQRGDVKIRYSHQPTTSPKGLSIVMRILAADGEGNTPDFATLGYTEDERALQQRGFHYPHGIVLYTGPTGSGKSTALAAGVATIPKTKKILSYEDPVENKMPGVCQVQVNPRNPKTTFAAYARSALRQDPDVIIYGEIRDREVMQYSIEQANTGHLVLSTLHTNTAPEALQRMRDLGCEWSRLASPSLIRMIVGQRLVRTLCRHCAIPLAEAVKKRWGTDDHLRVLNWFQQNHAEQADKLLTVDLSDHDCDQCDGKGEAGRLPLVEIVLLDGKGREFIREGDLDGWIEYLRKSGWRSMRDKAIDKVLSGHVCPVSVEGSLETPFGINSDEFNYTEYAADVKRRQQDHIKKIMALRPKGVQLDAVTN